MQAAWEKQAEDLVTAWGSVQAEQVDALVDAVAAAVEAGDEVALATLSAPVMGEDLILAHMTDMAGTAITAAQAEAAAQGVTVANIAVEDLAELLAARANAMAALMARSIADSASRHALLRYGTSLDPAVVSAGVRAHLEELTNAFLNDSLGGALTQAQNAGRRLVMTSADGDVSIYSSELLDTNTCEACAAVDGTQYTSQTEADADYPTGGYADCFGGPRSRGTLVAVYGEGE
jgi:hypothetical protein